MATFKPTKHISKQKVQQELRQLLVTGQILSNLAYNLSQTLPDKHEATRLRVLYQNWDKAKDRIPTWMKQ